MSRVGLSRGDYGTMYKPILDTQRAFATILMYTLNWDSFAVKSHNFEHTIFIQLKSELFRNDFTLVDYDY